MSVISSKLVTYKETNEFITNFLGYIDLDSISTKDINELKYKILLLNNLYDLSMKYFNSNKKDKKNESKNNNGNNDEKENAKIILLNKFFYFFINSFEKKRIFFFIKKFK